LLEPLLIIKNKNKIKKKKNKKKKKITSNKPCISSNPITFCSVILANNGFNGKTPNTLEKRRVIALDCKARNRVDEEVNDLSIINDSNNPDVSGV
jgi:hypothetical protein